MLPFVKLIDNFDAQYHVVANDGDEFTFLTNRNAPKNKLVRVDIKKPELWTDILPEHERDVLESADAVNGNQLLVCYMSDVKHILQIRDLVTGNLLHKLPLEIGSVSEISCRREDMDVFIGFTSFLSPGIIYRCNLTSAIPEMKIFREISVPGFDRTNFEVKQVHAITVLGCHIIFYTKNTNETKYFVKMWFLTVFGFSDFRQ
jgi:prolyl oligopeptidase